MAAKSRYGKAPKISDKESGGDKGGKPTGAGRDPKAETAEKKTAAPTKTPHGKDKDMDAGTGKKDPGPTSDAPTGMEESGIPVHGRHAAERAEMHSRHMMDHVAMHGRHEREHLEARMGRAQDMDA